jgi:hypothetical protein
MPDAAVIVARGVIDVPDFSSKQREPALLNSGFSARTFAHTRRYTVGQTLLLSKSEAERLAAAGIVSGLDWSQLPRPKDRV